VQERTGPDRPSCTGALPLPVDLGGGRFYGPWVALQGWAEFLAWMQQQSAAGTLDTEVAWGHFRGLAATSEHVGLAELVVRFRVAPARDRLALAGTIASLLAPVEWPAAWHDARWGLWHALSELVSAISDGTPYALPRVLNLRDEHDLYIMGWHQLSMARDLLRLPCRRDELRVVARLCVMGNFACWRAFTRSYDRLLSEGTLSESVRAARQSHLIAFAEYATAARMMNDVCGTVLFTGLDPRLPTEYET